MTRQQGRRWALVVGILLVFGLGFLTSECQARQRATPDRVTVRVIDDGAKGGPSVVATQVVPLR